MKKKMQRFFYSAPNQVMSTLGDIYGFCAIENSFQLSVI